MVFNGLPKGHFGAILADPPWRFQVWSEKTGNGRSASNHYATMLIDDIYALPVKELAAKDSVLFLWAAWPMLAEAMKTIEAWGFTYKTCAFAWMKADGRQLDMFRGEMTADMKMGYWTRSNSEVCLLATRGEPKRLARDVRQGIIEPARRHSRKPEAVYEKIERLVEGPYLELFARRRERVGWTLWGNEAGKLAGTKPNIVLAQTKPTGVA